MIISDLIAQNIGFKKMKYTVESFWKLLKNVQELLGQHVRYKSIKSNLENHQICKIIYKIPTWNVN